MRRSMILAGAMCLGACSGGGGAAATPAGGAPAAAAATDPAVVRAAIDSGNARALAAVNGGTVDGMVGNYADDAMLMLPGMPAMKGKAAIEAGMKGMFQSMELKNWKVSTADVAVSGDLAVETGTLIYDSGPKGGKLVTDTTKYVTVWRKQADGSWKIIRDINNTDIAPKM